MPSQKRKREPIRSPRRIRPNPLPSPSSSSASDEPSPIPFITKTVHQTASLDLQRREIRLVQLVKNPDTHIIRLNFHLVSLDSNISYTALSYMWGDASPTREIFLDGEIFEVRENLWQFLYQVRKQGWYGLFWVDAICIDQEYIKERNHQVALMRSIYERAERVAVWLGCTADNSDVAMDHLNSEFYQDGEVKRDLPVWETGLAEAILELCERRYWRRIWIVQEVVLGKQLVYHCGEKTVQGHRFTFLFEGLDRLASDPNSRSTFFQRLARQSDAASIIRQRTYWHGDPNLKGFEVIELLNAHKFKNCTDFRDRIYGLLSLVNERQIKLLDITADYTKSTSEIYRRLLRAYCDVYKPDRTEVENLAKTLYDLFQFSAEEHWVIPFLKDLNGRVRKEEEEDYELFTEMSGERNCISWALVRKNLGNRGVSMERYIHSIFSVSKSKRAIDTY